MKRSWIGAGLLLALLITACLSGRAMVRIHEPIARDLAAAGEAALGGNWEQALLLSRQAGDNWEEKEVFRACFADHNPTEEIDGCFAQLEIYGRMKEETAFAAACAETARKVEAIGEAHKLLLHNFL